MRQLPSVGPRSAERHALFLLQTDAKVSERLAAALTAARAEIQACRRCGFYAQGLDSLSPVAPHRIVNIAGGQPIGLMAFIATIERVLGRTATKRLLPMQPGDVPLTFASAELLEALTGYRPATGVEEGVQSFVQWYRAWKGSRPA